MPAMNYLLVNAPDTYFGGYSWYDFAGDPDPGVRRSRGLLFDLLDSLWLAGYVAERTTVFGFSQGSLMALEVGVRYPQGLAGVIGVSGYVHRPEDLVRGKSSCAQAQRFLLTHGTLDPLIPLHLVRGQVEFLQRSGLNIFWREFEKAHTIAGEAELGLIRDFVLGGLC